jgi:biotin carboxyl carrier protein
VATVTAAPGSLRVRTTPASARPADQPLILGPDPGASLETIVSGRAVLVADDRTPLLVSALRGADPAAPRLLEIVLEGWRFEMEIEPAARAALRERASSDRRAIAHGPGAEVRAIIPGRVVAVSVAPGDPVSAGQQLLVVEAMKMQNEVRTPIAGVVEKLAVAEGQTIELGDLLAVIGAGG